MFEIISAGSPPTDVEGGEAFGAKADLKAEQMCYGGGSALLVESSSEFINLHIKVLRFLDDGLESVQRP